jgi:hypothetical protein
MFTRGAHQTQRSLSLLNVGLIRNAEADDAKPIEPLVAGGAKMAAKARGMWGRNIVFGRGHELFIEL